MLTPSQYCLINGHTLDLVPACLYQAKSNTHARLLAQADWLIRDKRNGKYLATYHNGRIQFFQRLNHNNLVSDEIATTLDLHENAGLLKPLSDARQLALSLRIDVEQYALKHQLDLVAEPYVLEFAGLDRYQRPLWLEMHCKNSWLRMQKSAMQDNIPLDAISGYRSYHYQMGIFKRKMARGQTIEQILNVNAAPGFSEHHSGRALDIGTRAEPAAEESFEQSNAFKWLKRFAGDFGFKLSYPRHNVHGINYEPWHWCWHSHH